MLQTLKITLDDKLKQPIDNCERVKLLTKAIGKAMEKDRTLQEYGDGHFALGYLRSLTMGLLHYPFKKEARHES